MRPDYGSTARLLERSGSTLYSPARHTTLSGVKLRREQAEQRKSHRASGERHLKIMLVEHPRMQQALLRVLNELGAELQVIEAARDRNIFGAANATGERDVVLLLRGAASEPRACSSAEPYGPELTERQQQVLALLLQGKPNKVISRELGLAQGTVKIHVTAILKKLKVANRTQAALAASRLDLAAKRRFIAHTA
jgi:DNA-binding CsgD family transcriptional regulator